MKIYKDISLRRFEPWSGACSTFETLTEGQLDALEAIIEDEYPDGVDETTINDILWFECDTIADWLGFKSWEALERYNNYGDEILVKIYAIEWEVDDEEDDDEQDAELPSEIEHKFEGQFEGVRDKDLIDEISDWLWNEYGWYAISFKVEEVEDT